VSLPSALPLPLSAGGDPAPGPHRPWWEFWRSPAGQPPWARPALLGIAAVAALLYARNITRAGLSPFYSVAVKSMSVSWKAFFYGAFDPKATITIDKLAGSFLPQALSARVFGFHPWSLALPQVTEGVVSVLVMYRVVRRWAGPVPEPGRLAAADRDRDGTRLGCLPVVRLRQLPALGAADRDRGGRGRHRRHGGDPAARAGPAGARRAGRGRDCRGGGRGRRGGGHAGRADGVVRVGARRPVRGQLPGRQRRAGRGVRPGGRGRAQGDRVAAWRPGRRARGLPGPGRAEPGPSWPVPAAEAEASSAAPP